MLQSSHDIRKKTVQILPPLSDIKRIEAKGNTTDVAAMVVEGWEIWRSAVSAPQLKLYTHADIQTLK